MSLKKRKKIGYSIAIALGILLLLAATISIWMFNKPHRNVILEKPSISISAQQLIDDFSTNEEQANKRYLDQLIAVEGILQKIDSSNGVRVLSVGYPDASTSVTCNLNPSSNKASLQLKIGDKIQIKGICTGFLLDVVLIDASIIPSNYEK
ncbi:OB-fold putative lipoprotein [Zunongwangia pacifica]|uniref:OB-fold putative lipoprotein n=1 Tax=Zunongwangia pacifica TaxID=2911062 RepID=A0A9X1ZP94_9FLAO|nr:OB-fold putative lipoprotein [Zunongwangia pacifica]MCL6216790.1 OB-fold putative lipoprotein [Zunongwangia pacifica]